jgi:hypothetical protein
VLVKIIEGLAVQQNDFKKNLSRRAPELAKGHAKVRLYDLFLRTFLPFEP